MKTPISIFTTSQGHLSLAESVKQALDLKNYSTYLNYHRGKEFDLYAPLHLYFPKAIKPFYQIFKTKKAQKLINTYAKLTYQDKTLTHLKKQKPKIVISTFYLYNHILKQANTHNYYLFLNIVNDPRTVSEIKLSKGAYNFVFDKKAVQLCQKLGIPENKIVESGWFVRDQFEEDHNPKKIKKELKLSLKKPTFLIVAGSEGTSAILKTLPAFLNFTTPLQIIFACGKNKKLFHTINAFSKTLKTIKPSMIEIIPLKFTKQIHRYMQAADLVIGKAGPNLLFESIATQTPFLATTHVAGQEDGNLDIIKEYRLGFVEENTIKAIRLIKKIAQNPHSLKQLQKPLLKLAQKNKESKKILANFIQEKLKSSKSQK